ncbi:UDP-N-acetylmuramoyl-L-alanine--D-glutamate ligase [Ideonella sp. BN130291]|uniref:UDP-N-acetylmuramoyl-L-alanine--D-glutamate ligase n=1 Tax=Ideonella sp. BN130291 TaxID=3112940 RepID=UPI002E26320B|nr:UDP-N-acetylmuramoyl-L-alanine--D-glutamate ligase [Ideonella sp. BN130291]
MNYLRGLSVLILGLGDSGLAMARWCVRCGAERVRVWDSRETPPKLAELRDALPQAEFSTGAIDVQAVLAGVQLVLKSPGLAPTDERIAPLLNRALDTGLLVQGELDLFNRALADLKAERRYEPKVLAITGTNGKTTTTALTALLVERAGKRVATAGNIGPTMLDTLAAALDLEPAEPAAADDAAPDAAAGTIPDQPAQAPAGNAQPDAPAIEDPQLSDTDAFAQAEVLSTERDENEPEALAPAEDAPHIADTDAFATAPVESTEEEAPLQLAPPPPKAPVFEHLPEVWVLELSSFQLDEVKGFEPSAAVVLNITQDHLDWHGDMAAYVAAKARIFGREAPMVINRDDPQVERLVPEPIVVKGAKGRPAKTIHRKVVRFGLDEPQRPGDFGLVTQNGMAWLVRAMESDETIKRKKGEEEEIILQRLMPADALRIRGRHNAANALAALALATAIGCPLAPMLHGLREYTGEPHRVEYIGTIDGVEAFDDSKGTNVGATVAALNGLGLDKAPARLVVILGGDGKGQDFAPLREPVSQHVRAVALIGRDAAAIDAALAGSGVAIQRHDSLEAATRWCFEQAQPGDAVLLSPACASLDMFRNYKHRAEVFVSTVHDLAADRGESLA